MSEANSFQVPASDIDGNCSMRLSIEPSAFGIANVFEKVDTAIGEAQCDLWTVAEMAEREKQISMLSEQLEQRQQVIDELEKKYEQVVQASA